jgi:hypothetical protein
MTKATHTTITLLTALCLLVALPAGLVASPDYDVVYDASTGLLPNESHPVWTLYDTAFPENPVVSAGRLTLATSQDSENMYYIQTDVVVPDPLVIEVRVKRSSGTTYSDARAPIVVAFTISPSVGNALWIGNDEMFLLAGNMVRGETAVVDTDNGFHTYRIEVDSTGAIQVFYDDVLKLDGTVFTHTGANGLVTRVLWGDLSIHAHGASEWQLVRHNAGTYSTFLPLITRAQ